MAGTIPWAGDTVVNRADKAPAFHGADSLLLRDTKGTPVE